MQINSMSPVERALKAWPPMAAIAPALAAEIRRSAASRVVPAGTYLFRKTDPCSHIAIVGSGSVRVHSLNDEGRQITLYRIGEGETCLLTLTCVLGHQAHAGHAVAETNVEVGVLPATRFRDWIDRSPELRRYVFSFIAERTTGMVDLIERLFLPLDRRLAGSLLNAFGDRENVETTHTELAADVGTSREVVSRHLKDFEKQGVVDLGRGVLDLRDRHALEHLYRGRASSKGQNQPLPSTGGDEAATR